MVRKSVMTMLIGAATLALLAGCHGGSSSGYSEPAGAWSNYKCTVTNSDNGRASIGWATSESRARDNALDKCYAHASRQTACKVTQCQGG